MNVMEMDKYERVRLGAEMYITLDERTLQAEIISLTTSEVQFMLPTDLEQGFYNIDFEIFTIPYSCKIKIKSKQFNIRLNNYKYDADFIDLSDTDLSLINRSLVAVHG